MEIMFLKEYIELRPIEKSESINLRSCALCKRFYHYKNMAYIMASNKESREPYSYSFNICPNCLPHWKNKFAKDKHPYATSDEWNFSTWDLDRPIPHPENDRVLLYLLDEQFCIHINYNPSRRERYVLD